MFFCQVITLIEATTQLDDGRVEGGGTDFYSRHFSIMMMLVENKHIIS